MSNTSELIETVLIILFVMYLFLLLTSSLSGVIQTEKEIISSEYINKCCDHLSECVNVQKYTKQTISKTDLTERWLNNNCLMFKGVNGLTNIKVYVSSQEFYSQFNKDIKTSQWKCKDYEVTKT